MTDLRTGTPLYPRPKAAGDPRPESAPPAAQASPHGEPASATRRPVELIARAKEQLRILTGYSVDSVSGFTKSDGGWHLSVTMVELRRIPPITDMLAGYDVELDAAGNIVSYRRGRRYFRDQVGDDK